jgi:uncharacterized phiE125 gp8 family phage protein
VGLTLLSRSDDQPLSAADLLVHVKELDSSQYAYVDDLAKAATELFEGRTGRALFTQQWIETFDRFPVCESFLKLQRPPLQTVDLVEYRDPSTGVWTTWASSNYTVDASEVFGRIVLAVDATWPGVLNRPGSVRVTFTAGYGENADDVPADMLQALRYLVGHWYEHREPVLTGTTQSQLPYGAEDLMNRHVVSWV